MKKKQQSPAIGVPAAPAPVVSEILDLADAAALLRVEPQTLYSWTRSRSRVRIPYRRLGKFLRFERTELLTWFNTLGREKNSGRPFAKARS